PASLVPSSSDTAPAQLYTLSLHDALPIFGGADRPVGLLGGHADKQLAVFHHDVHVAGGRAGAVAVVGRGVLQVNAVVAAAGHEEDRKSTRLNSSHVKISYAVFCLKKKKER